MVKIYFTGLRGILLAIVLLMAFAYSVNKSTQPPKTKDFDKAVTFYGSSHLDEVGKLEYVFNEKRPTYRFINNKLNGLTSGGLLRFLNEEKNPPKTEAVIIELAPPAIMDCTANLLWDKLNISRPKEDITDKVYNSMSDVFETPFQPWRLYFSELMFGTRHGIQRVIVHLASGEKYKYDIENLKANPSAWSVILMPDIQGYPDFKLSLDRIMWFDSNSKYSEKRMADAKSAIEILKKRSPRIILIITPYHPAFHEYLKEWKYTENYNLYKKMCQSLASENGIELLDLTTDGDFKDPGLFKDSDHVNEKGASVMLKKIRSLLENE